MFYVVYRILTFLLYTHLRNHFMAFWLKGFISELHLNAVYDFMTLFQQHLHHHHLSSASVLGDEHTGRRGEEEDYSRVLFM